MTCPLSICGRMDSTQNRTTALLLAPMLFAARRSRRTICSSQRTGIGFVFTGGTVYHWYTIAQRKS